MCIRDRVNTNKTWSFDELKSEIRKIWGVSSKGSTSSSAKSNIKSGSDNTSSSSNSSSSSSNDTSSSSDGDASIIQDID